MVSGKEKIEKQLQMLYDIGFRQIKWKLYSSVKNKNDLSAWITAIKP